MKAYNEKDILRRKLIRLFPDEKDRNEVISILNTYGTESYEREPDRVRLAILKISGSDIESIKRNAAVAKQDYRDSLAAAEYPNQFREKPLPDGPRKQELIEKDRQQYEKWLFGD